MSRGVVEGPRHGAGQLFDYAALSSGSKNHLLDWLDGDAVEGFELGH